MFTGRRVLVILNPASGKGEASETEPTVRLAVESHGAATCEVRVTTEPKDATAWAAAAGDEGFDLLLAGGGDGTVTAVAAGVLSSGSRLPIGILPLGTGNGLARVLGLSMQPLETLDELAGGRIVEIDAVEVTSHGLICLMFLGAGLDARINRDADSGEKARMGLLAYLKAALSNLRGVRNHDLTITLDQQQVKRLRGHSVSAFNATRFTVLGVPVGPDAQPHDGVMDVVVLRSTGFWRNLGQLLRLFNRAASQVELEPVKHLRVEAIPSMPVQVDGDVVGRTPLDAEVKPAALRFIAAAGYGDDRAAGGA